MAKSKIEFLRTTPQDAGSEKLLSFIFKLVTILLIIAGLQTGAQLFARSVAYEPGWCGSPLFQIKLFSKVYPVYPFYRMLWWVIAYYLRPEIHSYLYAAWKITGVICAASIAFYLSMEFFLSKHKENIFGTARWAQKDDLEKAGLLNTKGGVILGQLQNARLSCKYDFSKNSVVMHLKKPSQKLIQAGVYNTILTAPTRSGKGVSCVIPTLLAYPGSVIVLDFKGELFNVTSGFRSRFGPVYRWNPTGAQDEPGHHFNPMEEIRPGDYAYSDANLIADILTTPASGGENSSGEHFRTGAKDLLTGLILHCLTDPKWTDKSLAGCRSFLNQVPPEDQKDNKRWVYEQMINANHGDNTDLHAQIVESASAQMSRPDDEGGSMKSTVNNALSVFSDSFVRRNSATSEFYIDEFIETERPITLYLTIQYDAIQRIAPLIRMFVTLFSRRFTGGETQATARKFKVPLLFILDEFDKLGRMDELETNMGIHNGFGIHYFLIFQSLNQLNKIYSKDHSFLGHSRNSIFYAPGAGEMDSAELISKVCGKESFSKANISYSGQRGALGFNNASLSSQDQQRDLINADEIIKLPLDCFILVAQGLPPYIGKKNVYYEDKLFTSRIAKEPAFKTRAQAAALAKDNAAKIIARRWFRSINHAEIDRTAVPPDTELHPVPHEDQFSGFPMPPPTEYQEDNADAAAADDSDGADTDAADDNNSNNGFSANIQDEDPSAAPYEEINAL